MFCPVADVSDLSSLYSASFFLHKLQGKKLALVGTGRKNPSKNKMFCQ